MSTEHQKYSTENQSDAIRQYAARRSIEIVRTYSDEGRSGLTFGGRDGLSRLIADVQAGQANFNVILVYDVSRWGRFQDADESAYYEYVCKRAGIAVEYCAEQFENDGSIASTIVKTVKRAMAGEYSRELSVKVFAGQCRLIELGFRQGGPAGYGLRRQLIDEHRRPKGLLGQGEQKSLQTDRVVLVPGPETEVVTIRRIYRDFVERRLTEREIATLLNQEDLRTDLDRPWNQGTVRQVLTNEKYCGHNVYNRTSFKLKRKRVHNDPTMWVRAENAFEALIEPDLFRAAQVLIEARNRRFSDQEMLDRLKMLRELRGHLSALIIDGADDMPSSSGYRSRFGSLIRAYELIGYTPDRDYRYIEANRFLRRLHRDTVQVVVDRIRQSGASVAIDNVTDLLSINDEFTASLVVSRAVQVAPGRLRWKVRLDTGLRPDISVVVRMDAGKQEPRDYLLLPRADICDARLQIAEENGLWIDAYRFESFEPFYRLVERVPIGRAA